MKALKILSFLICIIILSNINKANPIILFHINEIQIDSSGWKLELKNLDFWGLTSLDICYISTLSDTAYFKPGIAITFNDSFLVITQDSLIDSLSINRQGDIIGFHYLDDYPLDKIGFGNLTNWSLIAAPQIHQSICLREWHEDVQRYYYYLDNTPTFGNSNDALNAKGNVTGIISDSIGNPLQNVEVVYDFYSDWITYYDISVFTDSTGNFIFGDYARLNTIEIRKQNCQTEYVVLQIWPEDTVTINVTLNSVIDAIGANPPGSINNFKLSQNYPNPFNNSTTFSYTLPKSSFVDIAIYNLEGKRV